MPKFIKESVNAFKFFDVKQFGKSRYSHSIINTLQNALINMRAFCKFFVVIVSFRLRCLAFIGSENVMIGEVWRACTTRFVLLNFIYVRSGNCGDSHAAWQNDGRFGI